MSNTKHPWAHILRRELAAYFSSPIAYIVIALFLIFSGTMFFSTFFLIERAELRGFFSLLPVLFSFFIPAISMRLFAEELRSGSMETLITLPVHDGDVVIGKYLAAWISSISMLLPTLVYVVTVSFLGTPDFGPIAGGYLGALFLSAAFCAIGIFASSLTRNQIVAFFIAFSISIVLSMLDMLLILVPAFLVPLFEFLSAGYHFESLSKGIIDSRDLLYFASVTALFIGLTGKNLEKRREG